MSNDNSEVLDDNNPIDLNYAGSDVDLGIFDQAHEFPEGDSRIKDLNSGKRGNRIIALVNMTKEVWSIAEAGLLTKADQGALIEFEGAWDWSEEVRLTDLASIANECAHAIWKNSRGQDGVPPLKVRPPDTELVAAGIGQRMKLVRLAAGLTAIEVAKKMGTSPAAVSRWENGTLTPTWRSLVKFSKATLHEQLHFLFGDAEWVEPLGPMRMGSGPETDDPNIIEAVHLDAEALRPGAVVRGLDGEKTLPFNEMLQSYASVSGRLLGGKSRLQETLNARLKDFGPLLKWPLNFPRRSENYWKDGQIFSVTVQSNSNLPVMNDRDIAVIAVQYRRIAASRIFAFLPEEIGIQMPESRIVLGYVHHGLQVANNPDVPLAMEDPEGQPHDVHDSNNAALVYGIGHAEQNQPLFAGTLKQIQSCLLGMVIYRGGPPMLKASEEAR
ncbi:transcriptional regulator [uncultured Mediterranean phage uvDeep-CGR2-AD3-C191]|nr:transcriptional regulator [uncultured Mediterranean phage uvDeep-CGR2-AD3-C191]